MKTCFKCGEEKELSEFYRHKETADGHLNKCKECAKRDVRGNRRKNLEHYREYDRKRGNRQSASYERDYRRRFPEKYKAHTAVSNAIKNGTLIKEPCLMCGKDKVVGHHVDYSKPLDVIWLCYGCHKLIHVYEDMANEIRGSKIPVLGKIA